MAHVTREVIFPRFLTCVGEDLFKSDPKAPLAQGAVLMSGAMKTGTTWMQQILHSLRSGEDVEFENIHDVVPLIEFAVAARKDLRDWQKFDPPMYKSHSLFEGCPPADKAIFITRDPCDAALSWYNFLVDFVFTREELDLDDFVRIVIVESGEDDLFGLNAYQLKHLASWYPHRRDENVLWLHFEDLKADLKQCIKEISDFTGVGVGDQERLDLVERCASLEFMKQNVSKFTNAKRRLKVAGTGSLPKMDLEKLNRGDKVVKGDVNESRKALSAEARQAISQKWMELIKPVTGYDSYDEMRAAVNREFGRSFAQ